MLEPTPKPIPDREAAGVQRLGEIHAGVWPLFVHEPALEYVLDYSEQQPRRELGGFLLGGVFHDRGQEYVEVEHFIAAEQTQADAASVTFTHETWSALHREVEESYPESAVVGWHHTHPNFGIFLSAHDRFIHQHFFQQPWQVALVVDPQRHEFGFYQWAGEEIVDTGFYCLLQELLKSGE